MKITNILLQVVITLCLFLLPPAVRGQLIIQLKDKFTVYQQQNFQEKIFVHTDKATYLASELIWFSIYNTDGILNAPVNLSKIVYVEVLDMQNKALLQVKVNMKEGFGSGSVYLPLSISSGNYKFRAYTGWMKNFDPDQYFEKTITIINTQSSGLSVQETKREPDIRFFPEGGSLVAGLNSKVACKVIGENGMGIAYKAIIFSDQDTVARFSSSGFGIGTFEIRPVSGVNYYCTIVISDKTITKPLPAVTVKGYVLNTTDTTGNKISVTIASTVDPSESIYLVAHSNQVIKDAQSAIMNGGRGVFTIDKEKLGDGVSTVTIFNSSGKPVCGRLYFKPVSKKLLIGTSVDKPSYLPRNKVNLKLNSEDGHGIGMVANLSLSVYKEDILHPEEYGHIQSYLWLTSALKGPVENADYYLKDQSSKTLSAADDLLLTQGWRKYIWDDILSDQKPVLRFLPEHEGHIITGKVSDISGRPLNKTGLYFSLPGKQASIFSSESKADGSFIFNVKGLFGNKEIVIQTNSVNDTTSVITLNNVFSEQYSNTKFPVFDPKQYPAAELEQYNLYTQVQNAYYGTRLRTTFEVSADTSAFYGSPVRRYLMDDYTRFNTMQEIFREFISTAYMVRESGETQIRMSTVNGMLESNPLLILNGTPIFSTAKMMKIDPRQIRAIDIINHRYLFGNRLEDGILNLSTYKNDMAGYQIEPNALILDYEGLQHRTEFYAPSYENKADIERKLPDFRNVLTWMPELVTDKDGMEEVSFYTSDQTGNYIGVVQGITTDGRSGYATFKFKVKGNNE